VGALLLRVIFYFGMNAESGFTPLVPQKDKAGSVANASRSELLFAGHGAQ